MNKRVYLISAGILFGALMAFFALRPKPTTAQSLDTVFSSPINGGCYIAAPNQCKIHIDPFTINHNTTLMQFTMYANGSPIYDFRTDVSNPPSVNYSPSLVALDFAATCGESYVVNMTARAIDNPSPLNAGQTTEFTCPAGVPLGDALMVAISPKFSLRRRALLGLLGALAAGALMALGRPQPTRAAPELTVYASPIQAGCYLATRSTCKIHVDPFTIFHSGGSRLVGFQLRANGSLIYDFKTDVSNPPAGNYSPSRVKLDFAASCGQTYTINLLGRDSSSEGYINLGQVENVVCPQGVNENFLPLIVR